ncbi:hypothetical protein ACGFNU_11275 [Spirillospora sp. NPDC048911]|uniref:hypothetical protein n=1 Tax=Spirillospora sp. NPDC048911 TaxID=3364527 RepID=UPI0037125EE8
MSALDDLDLSTEDVIDLIRQLEDEAPAVADLMRTLHDAVVGLSDDDVLDAVCPQSTEMRRPHLRIVVALYSHALERLGASFGAIDIESRLDSDNEPIELWDSAIELAKTVLSDLVDELGQARGERGRT